MASGPGGIGLGDLISRTAAEIRKARDAAPKDDAVLTLTDCELELAVTVGAEVGGGIKVWLIDVSGKAKAEQVSRIKLKFGPAGSKPTAFSANQEGNDKPIQGGKRAARTRTAGPK